MSRGGATRPTSKPRDVHSTDAERPNSRHLKNDKRAYTQVYLARARIEGIEKWRTAVDVALQAAEEDCEEQEANMNRQRIEEDMEQEKTEGTGDIEVEVLEQEVCDQLLTVSSFLLTSLLAD
jgi:hypothetical protein